MTLTEWAGFELTPILAKILDRLNKFEFPELQVADTTKRKVSAILKKSFVKNLTLDQTTKDLSKVMSKKRAALVARTETVRVTAEALLDDFADKGVERARWSLIPDLRVCEKCKARENMIYTISRARNKIPLHPRCRCTWQPSF